MNYQLYSKVKSPEPQMSSFKLNEESIISRPDQLMKPVKLFKNIPNGSIFNYANKQGADEDSKQSDSGLKLKLNLKLMSPSNSKRKTKTSTRKNSSSQNRENALKRMKPKPGTSHQPNKSCMIEP